LIEGLKGKMDVVGAMLFLASPLSDSMTGQTINVDGVLSWRRTDYERELSDY
jgi:NAD(P)-dependent dehydrogenase (short-subunit alcohol dehydrogenase family)